MSRPGVTIVPIHGHAPRIDDSAFVAPGCVIIGNVEIGAWPWIGTMVTPGRLMRCGPAIARR